MRIAMCLLLIAACTAGMISGLHAGEAKDHWKSLAELKFPGGYPAAESAERLFDELDFQRAVQVYLWALPAMNIDAMRQGSEAAFGAGNHILPVWKDRLNTKTKVTTPNSDVVYAMSYLDLKDGPVVVEVPPGLQGMFDDFWHRPIADVGFVGPDKGKGENICSCLPTTRATDRTVTSPSAARPTVSSSSGVAS